MIPFILTIMAGLSTLIGTIFIFTKINNIDNLTANTLAFSSSVMITISIIDLIPESLNLILKDKYINNCFICCFICILIGLLFTHTINTIIPKENTKNKQIYRVGILSTFALIIHNIPEGIITYLTSTINIELGLSLAIAIALHNIPDGLIQYVK